MQRARLFKDWMFFCFVFLQLYTAQTHQLHHGAETGLWGRTGGREGRKGVEMSTETEREAIGACYGGGRLVELLGKGRAAGRGSVKSGCRLSKEPSKPRVSTKTTATATATPPALRLYENAILISAQKNCISDQYDSSLHQARSDPSCRFYSLSFSCLSPLSLSFFIAL